MHIDKAPATETKNPNTVTLDTPIQRGATTIDAVTLRKPNAGELRGTSLQDLVMLDVNALSKVLPRISEPPLTPAEVARMDPADLVQLGGLFAGFLAPKAVMEQFNSQNA